MTDAETCQNDDGVYRPVILAFPGGGDQYTDCFYAELSRQGATVRPAQVAGRWLLRNLSGADFAHFHWPSFHYSAATPVRTTWLAVRFAILLLVLRARGVRILWTAHNLYPHSRSSPSWLDYWVRMLLCRLSALVVVHGKEAAGLVMREFAVPARRIVVIDHGNFLGYYPKDSSKSEARRRLGWPAESYIYLHFGHCKRYKNIHKLVTCFQAHCDSPENFLAIVGRCTDEEYRLEIEAAIRVKPDRIVFQPAFVPDAELQYFMLAADVVVLPFGDVLTSGSAILALSFGRPVIAPRLGYLVDVVEDNCGILYDVNCEDGLQGAMRAVREREFQEPAIVARARRLSWHASAATVLIALRALAIGAPEERRG